MTIIEQATLLHYHRHRMSLYGQGTARALGWKEEASQQKRFDVLATARAWYHDGPNNRGKLVNDCTIFL